MQNINEPVKLPSLPDQEKLYTQPNSFRLGEYIKKNTLNHYTSQQTFFQQNSKKQNKRNSVHNEFQAPGPSFFNKQNKQVQQMYQEKMEYNQLQKNKFTKINNSSNSIMTVSSADGVGQYDSSSAISPANFFLNQNQIQKNGSFTMKEAFLNSTQSSNQLYSNKNNVFKFYQTNYTQFDETKQSPTNQSLSQTHQQINESIQLQKQKTLDKILKQSFSNISNLQQRKKSDQNKDNPFGKQSSILTTKSPLIDITQIEQVCYLRSAQAKQDFYLQLLGTNPQKSEPQYTPNIEELKWKINQQKHINVDDFFVQQIKGITTTLNKESIVSHSSQNKNLKKSTERKDMFLLNLWMEQMLNQVFEKEKKYWNYQEFFDEIELIYAGCMKEIARQVSLDCSERGQMLTKIWDIYSSIVRNFIEKSQKEFLKKELEQINLQRSIQNVYIRDLKKMQEQQDKLNELLELRNNQITKAKAENRYLSKKWKKTEKALQVIQDDFNAQINLYDEALKEITYLKMQQEEYILQDQIRQAAASSDDDYTQATSAGNSKFMLEIEKIKIELQNQYQFLYMEEKKKLEEAYIIHKQNQDKQLILAQEIEQEESGLEKNQLQRIQEYNFEDVLLANIGVDTSDLCQKQSFGTDTCDLVEKQDKCINVNIQKQMKYQSTQTVCTTESKAQQVNIRTIINENKVLTIEEQHYFSKIEQLQFTDLIKEYRVLKLIDTNILERDDYGKLMVEQEFKRVKKEIKNMINLTFLKEDMTQKDYNILSEFICKIFSSSENFLASLIKNIQNLFDIKNTIKIDLIDAQIDKFDSLILLNEKTQQCNSLQNQYNNKLEQVKKIQSVNNNQVQQQKQINVASPMAPIDSMKLKKKSVSKRLEDNSFGNSQNRQNKQYSKENQEKDKGLPKSVKKKQSIFDKTNKFNLKEQRKSDGSEENIISQIQKQRSFNLTLEKKSTFENAKEDELIQLSHSSSKNSNDSIKNLIQQQSQNTENSGKDQAEQENQVLSDTLNTRRLQELAQKQEIPEKINEEDGMESNKSIGNNEMKTSITKDPKISFRLLDSENDPFYKRTDTYERMNSMKKILNQQQESQLQNIQQESLFKQINTDEQQQEEEEEEEEERDFFSNIKSSKNHARNSCVVVKNNFSIKSDDPFNQDSIKLTSKSDTNIQLNEEQDKSIETPKSNNKTSINQIISDDDQQQQINITEDYSLDDSIDNKLNNSLFMQDDDTNKQNSIEKKSPQSIFSKFSFTKQKFVPKLQTQQITEILNTSDSDSNREELDIQDQFFKYREEFTFEDQKIFKPINSLITKLRLYISDSKNAQIATELLEKQQKDIQKIKKAKDIMQLNLILKLTSQSLVELFKSYQNLSQNQKNINPFHIFLYDSLVNTFGQNSMTISKYSKYIKSCFYYQDQNSRIKLITKFLTAEYDRMSYQFFIDTVSQLDETGQNGLGIVSSVEDQNWISPKIIQDYVEQVFGKILQRDKLNKAQKYLFSQREKVNINNQSKILLNFDQCIIYIIDLYEEIKLGLTKRYYDLFNSLDIQNNGLLDYDQFILIFKNVENEIHLMDNLAGLELFQRESDYISYIRNKKYISLLRFTQMAIDHNLFSNETQNRFLDCNVDEEVEKIKSVWPQKRKEIKMRLIKSGFYGSLYKSIIDKIDEHFSKQKTNQKYNNQIIFSIRILENESRDAMVKYQMNDLLSQEFNDIQSSYISLKTKKIMNRVHRIYFEKIEKKKEN
ncbi:hypothetical protein TTHERM_00292010 (macronuclear) [Tetrahymena thermophila SB210]|uniref:EF-hand domain-containing protein n=1 Tax=Tetrahymena thermophila (strain SB210) TaxID=312017 RepID=I7MKI2_TETTS|nr:hypothetical protein TTHERM_00292010 [Tetrahymena thermophila SB210]EAR98474.2 hypothetical protein TTHERM_00292010 [Tetrahymena thermophila SB210]|eukprot:XP_001018719.2 hypothetical protein TTHERM_00292010 [Tetrahymena thermophila SB210]